MARSARPATEKAGRTGRQPRKGKPPEKTDASVRVPARSRGPARNRPAMPVQAPDDKRIHLAPSHLGKLRQGTLKTLCGFAVVDALSPFALAAKGRTRCPACFRKVDADLMMKA